ncbi:MAG: tagG [Frankiales bacterium]|jgi:ABC-type polysaccharide/polyol phosphate export permease|nr:tagG [Frankiales bacterium]
MRARQHPAPEPVAVTTTDLPLATAREGSLLHWAGITWLLAKRTFRLRYLGSRLGLGWAFVQPVVQAAVLTFLFTEVFKVHRVAHYPLYVLSGIMTWQTFAGGVNAATTSAVDNAALLRKIPMPALVFPLSQVLSVLLVFAMQAVVLVIGAAAFGTLGVNVLLMPVVLLLLGLIAAGIGSFTCAFHPANRDVKFLVESALLMLFYATPILYDPSRVPPSIRGFLAANPMYGVVALARTALLEQPLDVPALGISFGASALLVVAGLLVFRRRSAFFADLA